MSTTLPLFWDLSSADKKKRLDASVKLVGTLEKFQASFGHESAEGDALSSEDEDDTEEGDDARGASAAEKMEHDSMLDSLNAPDVAYSIRRLVRGLASPRESSRLGFAVALTELLSRVTTISCAQILALLLSATRTTGGQTGQEERDLLFARLFGLTAIINSGLFVRTYPPLPRPASAPSTPESCAAVLDALRELAGTKSWLAEAAYWAIERAMDLLAAANDADVPWREEAVHTLLEGVFGEASSTEGGVAKSRAVWTPEKIAVALHAQMLWPGREREWKRLWAPTVKHGDVLHPANLATIARIFREGEVEDDEGMVKTPGRAWRPQVHHVWDELLDELLPPEGSGRSPRSSFQEFFRIVVDESLFAGSASNERKYWGFVIFQRALPRVEAADLQMLFTKNFMRTWINHLSHVDRYLHSFAKQIATGILSVVQKDSTLGFSLILQLTGVHGNQQFDKLTRTKTVESILTTMSAEGIKDYIVHLLGQAGGGSASRQSDVQVINARRSWIIEQSTSLVRNGAIPKDDEWVQLVLDWFIVHGIFFVKKKSQGSSISALHTVPSPPYPDHLRRQCRERLLSCLADLTQLSATAKTAERVQKITGVTSDGELWISRVLQTIRKLEQDSKHVALLTEPDQEDQEKLERARRAAAWLREVPGERREEAQGVELLLQSSILQFYIGDSPDARDMAPLESCINSASRLFPPPPEKPGVFEPFEDNELQLEPIDVLVDMIIGCLEKGTAYMRAVGNQSFSLLSGAVKDSTINLILSQLEHRNPSELLADSGEEVDEDDGYSENSRNGDDDDDDREPSVADVGDDESSNSIEGENEELEKRNTEILPRNGSDPSVNMADEESEGELDDDQMMAIDDQLAQILKDRERGKKDKEGAQREATHFKNRVMDLLDIFVRRQPASPYILQSVIPILTLTFSDEKQLSDKAAGLLKSRIGKLKEVPSAVDITRTSETLNHLHIRARKVHSRDALATISLCSLYVSRALLHVGADETVRTAYTVSLVDFTERKASDLNTQFFGDFIKRYPRVAWGMRAALLAAPMKAVNAYRRGQAYTLLEVLLNSAPLLPNNELDEVAAFARQLQRRLHSALSTVCEADTSSTSSFKEVLKLALVGARTTKRLAVKSDSFVGIWEPSIWTELHSRILAHDRFEASAVGGMCRQVIHLAQTIQAPPSIEAGERGKGEDRRDGVTMGSKRKADSDSGVRTGEKRTKRVVSAAKGSKKDV